MTREELKAKITQLSKMGFMASNFERSYGLPSQTIKHLFYAKCFSATRISKVINALAEYHKDFWKIIEK